MGKHPKLSELEKLFSLGKDFDLTDAQYEQRTGIPLPKDTKYIKSKSAVSKKAKAYGYNIDVIEKRIVFKKCEVLK